MGLACYHCTATGKEIDDYYISSQIDKGRGGGGLVVSMLVFYFDDTSLNAAEGFSVNSCHKEPKINKKRRRLANQFI